MSQLKSIVASIRSFLKEGNTKKLMIIPLAIIIALVLYRFKGVFVAATVNGQPITRVAVLKELEKEGGKQVLDNLVTNSLIQQEAKKEKVTVSQTDIDAQITQITNNLKAQGQELDAALTAQGMTKNDLTDQIKLKVLVDKMAGKDITVTDQEIQDNFNQNKSTYPKGTTIDSVKDKITNDLKGQKTTTAVNTWITNLKSKARINHFVSY